MVVLSTTSPVCRNLDEIKARYMHKKKKKKKKYNTEKRSKKEREKVRGLYLRTKIAVGWHSHPPWFEARIKVLEIRYNLNIYIYIPIHMFSLIWRRCGSYMYKSITHQPA